MIRAVLWDYGGVLTTSPFVAFARYEAEHGLEPGFLRRLNATNPDTNAWAAFERAEIDFAEFARRFEAEAAAAGAVVDGGEVLGLLAGELRPEMVEALRRCHGQLLNAIVTNNVALPDPAGRAPAGLPGLARLAGLLDAVIESSRLGSRKPEVDFYRAACATLGIAPSEAVLLDDLGVNLAPARALGMTTIKVVEVDAALDQLEAVVGFPLR